MKQCNRMRSLALLLLLSTIVSTFPILTSEDEEHIHTAEAASSCPFDGNTEIILYLGCTACGGSGSTSDVDPPIDLPSKGSGINGSSTETDGNGNVWTIYYRCYNCGVCPQGSVIAYKKLTSVNGFSPYKLGDEVGNNRGPGVVPKRQCSICGPMLQDLGQDYVDREASYGVYHIDPDKLTKTYTVDVVCNPPEGGSAGGGGEYEEGETASLWAAANDGYTFSGFSCGGSSIKVTGDMTITANFSKIVTPTPGGSGNTPTVTPKPYPAEIVLPELTPTPLPTKMPRPFEIAGPIVPPASADPPVIEPVENVHEDLCYTGYLHTCTQSSCYTPVYAHTSSCWGIVSSTTCSSCQGQNNAGFYNQCSNCGGSGKDDFTCTACNGSGDLTCNSCNGTGKITDTCGSCSGSGGSSGSCGSCGGDGKVSGTCGGSISDTNTHTSTANGSRTCTYCSGSGSIGDANNPLGSCPECGGSGSQAYSACSCGASGSGTLSHNYSYKCGTCGASGSSSGTCSATKANSKTCSSCSGSGSKWTDCSSCGGDGETSTSCAKTVSCTGCGGDGSVVGQCGTCTGTGQTWSMCTDCSGSGEQPVYGYRCGSPGGCYIDYYQKICGKTNGSYYLNNTLCSPLCHLIVYQLDPVYPEQVLQLGETPNTSAYATFISTEGTHGDYPTKTVTCTMSGYDSTKYNTWQTVTLSYGTYSGSAKNKKAATTTMKIYIAGDITVTFDAGIGTVSPSSKTVTYGETYGDLPTPTTNSDEYGFYGWLNPYGQQVFEDNIVNISTSHTLTAAWTSLEQTVYFDANGGSVIPTSKTVIFGKTYGTLPTPTREGYTFDGKWWYGDEGKTSTSIVEAYDGHTLVAHWIPNDYIISFNPNGGTCATKTMAVRMGSTANNSAAPLPTYPGYTFDGWYTATNGGSRVFDANGVYCAGAFWVSGKWEHPDNLTVYAQWKPNTYTVTLNGMGATTMTQTSVQIVFDSIGPKVSVPKKTGYVFDGYYTEPLGKGTKIYNSVGYGMNIWTIPNDDEVFACWTPISYIIEVAKDEYRVIPREIISKSTVNYDDTYTIPSALADKTAAVSYDFREETVGTSGDTISGTITTTNTTASMTFLGWQSFSKNGTSYSYRKLYSPGQLVQRLSSVQDAIISLFPYWSGDASYVTLPKLTCRGYTHIGWDTIPNETDMNAIFRVEDDYETKYKPTGNQTLYAYWEPNLYYVNLNDRGATSTTHTFGVQLFYDEKGADIIPPEKEGYTFKGYFTGIRGTGKQYYDATGKFIGTWTEITQDLYACWEQNEIVYPTVPPTPIVTAKPTQAPIDISIERNITYGEISSTDYDVTSAVPSTEEVGVTVQTGQYTFEATLAEKSGIKHTVMTVRVPYTTRYEDLDTEELIDSEVQYAEYNIALPRAYSYWTVASTLTRVPASCVITSDVFGSGSITLSYNITLADTFCIVNNYTQDEHVVDPAPVLTYGKTVRVLGDTPGSLPTIEQVKKTVYPLACELAISDNTQLTVKSDKLTVSGKNILSDTANTTGTGAAYSQITCDIIAANIPAVKSAEYAKLNETVENGAHKLTDTTLTFEPYKTAGTTRTVSGITMNDIVIHTPVVVSPDEETLIPLEKESPDDDFITIDDYSEFLAMDLSELLYGTHISTKGYGTRDYTTTVSGRQPFDSVLLYATVPLHFDINQDSVIDTKTKTNLADDVNFDKNTVIQFILETGTWYLVDIAGQKHAIDMADLSIYVLATECTTDFDITYGALAKNGVPLIAEASGSDYLRLFESLMLTHITKKTANTTQASYFAYDTISYDVHYKYITFHWYDTEEDIAIVSADELTVVTKQGYEAYFYVTQIEGFEGSVEIKPTFSLVDTTGALVNDNILVMYPDYRDSSLGQTRHISFTPADDNALKAFRSNWLKVSSLTNTDISQEYTYNHVILNDNSTTMRSVYGAEMPARHGMYRLPNGLKVLQVKDIPNTSLGTSQEFLMDWKIRDSIMQSDVGNSLPYATEGYLRVELDVAVYHPDGTPLIEYGSLPTISLYYVLGDETTTGLYYQQNGEIPTGDGKDDDVEVEHTGIQ